MATTDIDCEADSYLDSGNADTNFGASTALILGYSGGKTGTQARPIMQFDVSPVAGGSGIAASLWIYIRFGAANTHVGALTRLTRADHEEMQETWNIYKTGSNWTTPGGDFDGATPPAVNFNLPTDDDFWFEITGMEGFVTDAIANRGSKAIIHGRTGTAVTGYIDFGSRELAGGGYAPFLRITWTPPARRIFIT